MEWITIIISFIVGGGLMKLLTIKPERQKVHSEAKQIKANADTTEIQNYSQIAKEWREYAQEAEMRYAAMTKLMEVQIQSLTKDVAKISRQMTQILKIIKEMDNDNLEDKKKEAEAIARD